MGIPSGYSRVVIVGTLNGTETFETGFWVHLAPTSQSDNDALASSIASTFTLNAYPSLKTLITPADAFTEIRVYSYPSGGPTAAYISSATLGTSPGTGAGALPEQVCMVVTTTTGAAGRRNRGRIYLPATGCQLVAAKTFMNASVDNGVGGIAAMFTSLAAGQPVPSVVSQVGGSGRPITAVHADNKPDIQRRRAKNQISTYTKTTTI